MEIYTRHIGEEYVDAVLNGVEKVYKAVSSTMGAGGKTVLIANGTDLKTTKDGVSVAKAINLEDPIERMGGKLVVNGAAKTVEQVGDGTTATTVLTYAFLEVLKGKKKNIRRTLDLLKDGIDEIIEYIKENSYELTLDKIKDIATISSNSEEIGQLLADVYEQVGFNASVDLDVNLKAPKTEVQIKKGAVFGNGMLHKSFANQITGACRFDNPKILIVNGTFSNIKHYQEIMKLASKVPVVIIAKDISHMILRSAVESVKQNSANICMIKAPGFGDGVNKTLDDIIAFTGAERLQDMPYKMGEAESFLATNLQFRLYNDEVSDVLKQRLKKLKSLSENDDEEMFRRDYKERYDNLSGNNAIIFAGGTTPMSAQEEHDRIEDAIGSIKAAIRSGYVAGGGSTLVRASQSLPENDVTEILKKVCEYPFWVICMNADLDENIAINYLLELTVDKDVGYDAANDIFCNLVENGIVDPTEVIIRALENAFDTAKQLINTKHIIQNDVKLLHNGYNI